MRARLRQVVRHPSWVRGWWIDTPWRAARNWRTLLLEPGLGWLRWKEQQGWTPATYYEPGEPFPLIPPLHRLWWAIRDPRNARQWWSFTDDRWPEDYLVSHVSRRERRRFASLPVNTPMRPDEQLSHTESTNTNSFTEESTD